MYSSGRSGGPRNFHLGGYSPGGLRDTQWGPGAKSPKVEAVCRHYLHFDCRKWSKFENFAQFTS